MARTRLQVNAQRRHREMLRDISEHLRRLREDSGLTQTSVAHAAGLSQGYLSEIEAGHRDPTLETLHALAAVLGCDLSVRLFPNSGPAIRDRFQAHIVEALLRILNPRWTAYLEVPVHRPVRGIIDLVLADPSTGLLVATEVHSELRRVEQQLRWAHEKADALATTDLAARMRAEAPSDPRVSRLLVLRSTVRTRALARELATTFAVEFPADPGAILEALTTPDAPWPGPGLLWATAEGSAAWIQTRRLRTATAEGSTARIQSPTTSASGGRRLRTTSTFGSTAAATASSGNLTAHPVKTRPETSS